MKIILINALSAKVGGGKTYIKNLLAHFDDSAIVYIATPDKSLVPNLPRINYISTPFANRNILFRAFWESCYLPFLMSKLRVDVLFVPGGLDFTFYTKHVTKVTMFRNMLPFDYKVLNNIKSPIIKFKNKVLKHLMIRTMNSADTVIFISNYAKQAVINELNIVSSSVIYHGISSLFKPVKMEESTDKRFILYVSRFEPYKNHINLLKAYINLDRKLKSEFKLVIIGEEMEPTLTYCKKIIEDNSLEEHVKMLGKVAYEKLPEYYNSCTVFVFPSSCENCPNILLEAMGCGSAILSSNTQPMPEFAGKAAMYFDENDPVSIANTLQKVLESSSVIHELKTFSSERRSAFTWQNTAKKTWALLNAVGEKNNV